MASNGCLPGTNGQSCHAPRFFKVTCLLTLHLCIAFSHATVAPVQYWPLEGTTLLYGHRAACEHSEQITEMARKSTQNTSKALYTDTLSHSANESYCIQRQCDFSAGTGRKEPINRQACLDTDTLCLHSTNTDSIARLNPEPRRITDVGAYLRVADKDTYAFGQPIHTLSRPITPRPRQDLDSIITMLPGQKPPTQPFGFSQLTLASALKYQHSNISGWPMQAAMLDSQNWRPNLVITGIVKQAGIQGSAPDLAADLKLRCNQLAPGIIKSIPLEKVTIVSCNKVLIYQLQPVVDTNQVPQFLDRYRSANSPLSKYRVLSDVNSQVVVSGPPTIMVKQPRYEGGDRRLSIPLRLETVQLADHIVPPKVAAEWTSQCIRRWLEVAFPQLAMHYQTQGKFNMTNKVPLLCMQHPNPTTLTHLLSSVPVHGLNNAPNTLHTIVTYDYTLLHIDTYCSSRVTIVLFTVAYVYTNKLLQMRSGCTDLEAMDRAVTHPAVQLLEFHHTTPHKVPAHLYLHSFSQKAADRLQSAQYIELGVPGEFCIRLTLKGTAGITANTTWQYAVVSSPLPKTDDYGQAGTLLEHFSLLTQTAADTGRKLRKTRAPITMWFYDHNGRVRSSTDVNVNTIKEVSFTPAGDSFTVVSSNSRVDKSLSKAGLSVVFLPAEPMTAALLLFTCSMPRMQGTVGGGTLYYTTRGSSLMGRQVLKGQTAASKHSIISCLVTTGGDFAAPEQRQSLFQRQEKDLVGEAAQAINKMAPQITPAAVIVPAQAQSPEDLFSEVMADYDSDTDDQGGDVAGLVNAGQPNPGGPNLAAPNNPLVVRAAVATPAARQEGGPPPPPRVAGNESEAKRVKDTRNDRAAVSFTPQQIEPSCTLLSVYHSAHIIAVAPQAEAQTFATPVKPQLSNLTTVASKPEDMCISDSTIFAYRPRGLTLPRSYAWDQTRSLSTPTGCFQLRQVQASLKKWKLTPPLRVQGETAYNAKRGCVLQSIDNVHDVYHNSTSSYPPIHQHDAWHHLPSTKWGMTSLNPTTCATGSTAVQPSLVTYINRAAKLGKAVTSESQVIFHFMSTAVDTVKSAFADAKLMHNWHQKCQHSEVSSQAIQAYRLSLTKRVYMQRGLAARRPMQKTHSRLLEACSNVCYALMSELAPAMVTFAAQTLYHVMLMLHRAPSAGSRIMRRLQFKNMRWCLLYHSLRCVKTIDSALSNTHCMTHFVLICCELATMYDYIKRIVEDTGPYISLPALTCMIGLLIVRTIWLRQMLNEEQNARHNSQLKTRSRIDHPKCANGKYWSRIRYGQRKFAKLRQQKNQSLAQWIMKWVQRLLLKSAGPIHAVARFFQK